MTFHRNPLYLACLGALCLQRPAAAIYSAPLLNMLMILDGVGLLALAYIEHLLANPEE